MMEQPPSQPIETIIITPAEQPPQHHHQAVEPVVTADVPPTEVAINTTEESANTEVPIDTTTAITTATAGAAGAGVGEEVMGAEGEEDGEGDELSGDEDDEDDEEKKGGLDALATAAMTANRISVGGRRRGNKHTSG